MTIIAIIIIIVTPAALDTSTTPVSHLKLSKVDFERFLGNAELFPNNLEMEARVCVNNTKTMQYGSERIHDKKMAKKQNIKNV